MNELPTVALSLSPSFTTARKLSRFVAVLFTLGLLATLTTGLVAVIFMLIPQTPSGVGFGIGFPNGISVNFQGLHSWAAVGAMVAVELITVPVVLVLYHVRKLFLCFSKGEVFAIRPIGHVRAAGLWLTTSFFTSIAAVYLLAQCGMRSGLFHVIHHPLFIGTIFGIASRFETALFVGIPTIIAAYVMQEARGIAADNAGIV